jgi:subtilisin family serine protease
MPAAPPTGRFRRTTSAAPERRARERARLLLGTLVLALLASVALAGESPAQEPSGGEVLVRFAPGTGSVERMAARQAAGADFEQKLPLSGLQVVDPRPGRSAGSVVRLLERSEDVLYAEPNVTRHAFVMPNDQFGNLLWGMRNTGQSVNGVVGTVDADIDATEAWDVTTGNAAVTVGILDTGVDYTHSDLSPNIWANPGESGAGRETNGVDDDANDLVDDWHGWDWAGAPDDNDPADEHWHGTHVAGTVGAVGNDGSGVAGVSWQVALAPLRVLDAAGSGQVSDLIAAYGYAKQQGLRIVNGSLGGAPPSQAEEDALAEAPDTLFVFAAGNGGSDHVGDNNDALGGGTYPCGYDLPNVICVAATDNRDRLASFSNYGSASVDLAAPGVGIPSTAPGDDWWLADGTSMATPHVSGAAALQWSRFPSATVAQVRTALLSSVDVKTSLVGKTVTGGRLNVYRALTDTPPAATTPNQTAPLPPSASLPTAPLPAPAPTPDTTAPSVRVAPRGRLRLGYGVRVRTRCSEACGLRHELRLGLRMARRLGIRSSSVWVVGRARGRLGRAGTVTVRLKLTARARRRLRRTRSMRLELRTRAVDTAGNGRVVRRSIKLYIR